MAPTRLVVVVLPLLPVMPTTGPGQRSEATPQPVGGAGVAGGDLGALVHQIAHQVEPLDAETDHSHLLAPEVRISRHSILADPPPNLSRPTLCLEALQPCQLAKISSQP